jgi:ribosomal protein L37AE/L43A
MIAPSPAAWHGPVKPADRAENRERLKRPYCPLCGRRLLLAERSRFDAGGLIEHFWACDHCGTQFKTSIALTYQAVA